MEGKRILVVEDDELNMKLVRDVLNLAHYAILEATDAKTGIQLAREQHPDLILMDVGLPDMDGLAATRMIHADEALKPIPVVALTALAMAGDREKALEAGCIDYVSKPFRVMELLEVLKRHLNSNGLV